MFSWRSRSRNDFQWELNLHQWEVDHATIFSDLDFQWRSRPRILICTYVLLDRVAGAPVLSRTILHPSGNESESAEMSRDYLAETEKLHVIVLPLTFLTGLDPFILSISEVILISGPPCRSRFSVPFFDRSIVEVE